MTRRALLIGAQTGVLQGVDNDVEAMTRALEPRDFQVVPVTGAAADRAGILKAYEQLIADAGPEDACVVYYSGHGGLLRPPDGDPGGADLQFIVPSDYEDSTDEDFRGITDFELSLLLGRLTEITRNVTVVLDCCHSAHLSRRPDLRLKALLRPSGPRHRATYAGVQEHVRKLARGGARRPYHDTNPHAVRVVACAPQESAWEGANRDGVRMGLFTDALTRTLQATEGLRVNWLTLMDAVRREVQSLSPTQRPATEGPSTRPPFVTTDLYPVATLPVVVTAPGRIRLLGAPLIGVQQDDEFVIMPAEANDPEDGVAIGTAKVDGISQMAATAALQLTAGVRQVPEDARAHQTAAGAAPLAVRLPDAQPDLAKVVAGRPLVRAAEPGEASTVSVETDEAGRLVVHDAIGPLHQPHPATPDGINQIVANLQRIAQATALRRIEPDPAVALEHRVSVEWGRVRDGQAEPFQVAEALVYAHPSERIYFRLRNESDDTRYVSLIDIGISSRIGLLTSLDQGGRRIAAGSTYTFGLDSDNDTLVGVNVSWPGTVERTTARPETVLVVISDQPVDVSALQQDGVRGAERLPKGRATGRSALERLLAQAVTGATRDIGGEPGRKVRYAIVPVDFMVSPTAPPSAETARFLLDDRPAEPVRLLSPRGALPGRVAVRITDLVVHRNHAFGDADVRLDTVVLTGNGAGSADPPVHHATTMHFSNVGDGDRLTLDNKLIYLGPAVDFLDLAIWVSRDTAGSLALNDLLAEGLAAPSVQAAGAQLAGLALTAPHAAAAVAVAGACAVVVNTAYRLLLGVAGSSIGLYRTSLLAQEDFGIGRHEREAQDFSFTFSVEPVN